jgi:hypothetical protein
LTNFDQRLNYLGCVIPPPPPHTHTPIATSLIVAAVFRIFELFH